jgi:hypothetical protein
MTARDLRGDLSGGPHVQERRLTELATYFVVKDKPFLVVVA